MNEDNRSKEIFYFDSKVLPGCLAQNLGQAMKAFRIFVTQPSKLICFIHRGEIPCAQILSNATNSLLNGMTGPAWTNLR